jgi:hypothetical protein
MRINDILAATNRCLLSESNSVSGARSVGHGNSTLSTNVAAVACCDLALHANIVFLVAPATQSMLRFKSQQPRRTVAFEMRFLRPPSIRCK